jgi:TonB family protein
MKQAKPNESSCEEEKNRPEDSAREDVDALVSSFLEELTGISSDVEKIQQLETSEKAPVENTPVFKPAPRVSKADEEESFDSEYIDKEIEESLKELEWLKSKVVSISERKDSKPESSTPSETESNVPVVAPAAQAGAKSGESPAIPDAKSNNKENRRLAAKSDESPAIADAEEQEWIRLELFRDQIASRGSFPWLKPLLVVAILIAILGIPAYQLFRSRSGPAPLPGNAGTTAREVSGQASDLKLGAFQKPTAGSAVVKAKSIAEVPPIYPRLARQRKVIGTVVLEAVINEKGDVVRAKAVSGPEPLRKPAEEALMKWKFKPASADGVNIASREQISIDFGALR